MQKSREGGGEGEAGGEGRERMNEIECTCA